MGTTWGQPAPLYRDAHRLIGGQVVRRGVEVFLLRGVAPQDTTESRIRKRFIIFQLQAPKPSAVNLGSTWGQHGLNMGSTWVSSAVNLRFTWGQPGVNLGSTLGEPAPPHLGAREFEQRGQALQRPHRVSRVIAAPAKIKSKVRKRCIKFYIQSLKPVAVHPGRPRVDLGSTCTALPWPAGTPPRARARNQCLPAPA